MVLPFKVEWNEVFALKGKIKSWKIIIYCSRSDRQDINLMLFSFYCRGAQSCLLLPKQQMNFDFSSLNASLIPPPAFCLFSLPALWCLSWRIRGFSPVALQLQGVSVPISILYPKIQCYSPVHTDKCMAGKYWSCKYSAVEITTG